MAWSDQGNFGSNANKVSSTTITFNPSVAGNINDVVFVLIATDNTSLVNGDNSEVSSVTDTKTNTYTKVREFTNAQGGAGLGATTSMWMSKLTAALQAAVPADVITVTFVSARTAKSVRGIRFTIGAGNVVTVQAGADLANNAADPGPMNLTVPNAEFLWVRSIAHEGPGTDAFTKTASYTSDTGVIGTTGAAAASNMTHDAETRIFTGTSNQSDPTWTVADHASILVALQEAAPATIGVVRYRLLSLLGVGT